MLAGRPVVVCCPIFAQTLLQPILSLLIAKPGQDRPNQAMPGQSRPDQTRPDQTRPSQTRPDQTRPDQFIQYSTKPKLLNVFSVIDGAARYVEMVLALLIQ